MSPARRSHARSKAALGLSNALPAVGSWSERSRASSKLELEPSWPRRRTRSAKVSRGESRAGSGVSTSRPTSRRSSSVGSPPPRSTSSMMASARSSRSPRVVSPAVSSARAGASRGGGATRTTRERRRAMRTTPRARPREGPKVDREDTSAVASMPGHGRVAL